MKLVPYYKEEENNTGIIEEADENSGWIRVTNVGNLRKECCLDFEPQTGQKVKLWIDGTGRSSDWFLTLED